MDEFASWVEYRRKTGPLNPMVRGDVRMSILAELVCAAAGIKDRSGNALKRDDFMPYQAAEVMEDNVDNLATLMRGGN